MTNKRHSYNKTQESGACAKAAQADEAKPSTDKKKKAEADLNPDEKLWWGLTRSERIMAVLTLAGVLVAVFTGLIFLKQLSEMRADERPWITISTGAVQFPSTDAELATTQPTMNVTIDNTGKTPARSAKTAFVMEYVFTADSPEFIYEGRAASHDISGAVFPHDPRPFVVGWREAIAHSIHTQPRFLTPTEFHDLQNGDAYMAVYAESTYLDIFGNKHWFHYCVRLVPHEAQFKGTPNQACTDYNDTDSD